MDLIDRQAAIDAVLKGKVDEDESLVECPAECNAMIDGAVEDIKALPSAPRWSPVTERLPEPYSGEYLVTINDGSVYTDILWFDSPGDGRRYESCFYKTDEDGYGVVCDDVIAWMPLPEPWKGEDND